VPLLGAKVLIQNGSAIGDEALGPISGCGCIKMCKVAEITSVGMKIPCLHDGFIGEREALGHLVGLKELVDLDAISQFTSGNGVTGAIVFDDEGRG
jgi:hypothetical protein